MQSTCCHTLKCWEKVSFKSWHQSLHVWHRYLEPFCAELHSYSQHMSCTNKMENTLLMKRLAGPVCLVTIEGCNMQHRCLVASVHHDVTDMFLFLTQNTQGRKAGESAIQVLSPDMDNKSRLLPLFLENPLHQYTSLHIYWPALIAADHVSVVVLEVAHAARHAVVHVVVQRQRHDALGVITRRDLRDAGDVLHVDVAVHLARGVREGHEAGRLHDGRGRRGWRGRWRWRPIVVVLQQETCHLLVVTRVTLNSCWRKSSNWVSLFAVSMRPNKIYADVSGALPFCLKSSRKPKEDCPGPPSVSFTDQHLCVETCKVGFVWRCFE